MIFNERLREERELVGKTQKECASDLGVEYASYNKWENCNSPNFETLVKIADYFHVSTDYLLGRTDAKNPVNESAVTKLGLSEKAIGRLRLFQASKDKKSLDLINLILTDFRVVSISENAFKYSETSTLEKEKELIKAQINNEDRKKELDKLVHKYYGEGNAIILTGLGLNNYYMNFIKDEFAEIIKNHNEANLYLSDDGEIIDTSEISS